MSLPEALVLLICEFLGYDEQVEYVCCNKSAYKSLMRNFIRKVMIKDGAEKLLGADAKKYQTFSHRLFSVVNTTSTQVSLCLSDLSSPVTRENTRNAVIRFLKYFNSSFDQLFLSALQFAEIAGALDAITTNCLSLWSGSQYKEVLTDTVEWGTIISLIVSKLCGCQELSIPCEGSTTRFPHISTLRFLELMFHSSPQPLSIPYFSQLQKLVLIRCRVQDLSLFGSIPSLSFINCPDLCDISPLMNNQRVCITNCEKVRDYSRSFENTRVLQVSRSSYGWLLDFHHWKQLSVLILESSGDDPEIRFTDGQFCQRLPRTLRRCELSGKIIDYIDLHINSQEYPYLREISLQLNQTLTTFEGLGFECLSVIKCSWLTSLSSLSGLGSGKNRKVVIYNCSKIEDFSPLQHVIEVEITGCRGFSRLSEVSGVSRLRISSCPVLSSSLSPLRDFPALQSLDIRLQSKSLTFEDLKLVPVLTLSGNFESCNGFPFAKRGIGK